MAIVTLLSAVVALASAVAVLWANPRRFANRAFAVFFFTASLWLICVYQVIRLDALLSSSDDATTLRWLQANTIVAGWLPLTIWLLKESILRRSSSRREHFMRSLPWIGVALTLGSLSLTDSFFLLRQEPDQPHGRGSLYYVYILIEIIAYFIILVDASRELRIQSGIRRIELQFLVFVMASVCVTTSALNGIGSYLQIMPLKLATFPLLLASFLFCAWGITVHRILDARQVFLYVAHGTITLGALITSALCIRHFINGALTPLTELAINVALAGAAASWVEAKSRAWLDVHGERSVMNIRKAIITETRAEIAVEKLIKTYERLLREWCESCSADLLFDNGSAHSCQKFEFSKNRPGHATLCELGWATPESLQRRRSNPALDDVQQFLSSMSLAAIVTIPQGSPTPSLLVAIGTKISERPFTYREIVHLQNISELIDNILTRSRLTTQEAMKAKTEHLAMMSRGLAHDLKNLLTPVSSFLVHTEGRFPVDSVETEVHSAAQRSVRIMGDYVREARFFADRLAPRLEPCSLRSLCESAREIVASRAAARDITLHVHIGNDPTITVDSVLMQRLLGNLLANAVDASVAGSEVTLSASVDDHVTIQVADQGCGITPENLNRIFEPYFTTKEFGNEVRGFGLGLTICQKITALHDGTISVRSELDSGSTFTIELPYRPVDIAKPTEPISDAGPPVSRCGSARSPTCPPSMATSRRASTAVR